MSRMPTGWRDLNDASDWFRDMEKQMLREQRKRTESGSFVGTNIQGEAHQIIDWNDVTATYNGWFFTEVAPSTETVPAQPNNSPDETKAWLGQTRVDDDGFGVQYVTSYKETSPQEFMRRFYPLVIPGDQEEQNIIVREQITYGDWEAVGAGAVGPTGP